MFEKNFFEIALKLAYSAKGTTSPNPAVGAVLVKNGQIVGQGATQPVGKAHAEIVALENAGRYAKGATIYVTLEPCVNFPNKLTVACSTQLINAGIVEAYIGMKDPNPYVNGRGIECLKKAGIRVEMVQGYEKELQELNEDFFKFIRTGLPFVTAKYAMTLDGNIACANGDSKWISNEHSRKLVHDLRSRSDAVMVGIGTVLRDNPSLTSRMADRKKNPLRVVIDPLGKTSLNHTVMTDSEPTLFIVGQQVNPAFKELCNFYHKQFVEFDTPFNMLDLMRYLGKNNIISVLVEGGGKLLYSCLNDRVIDKILVFISPKLIKGKGIQPFEGKAVESMDQALKLKKVNVENIDEDILIKGYL